MPLSRKPNSHKATRKWQNKGMKYRMLAIIGGSNKKPIIKLQDVIDEYLKDIKDDNSI